MIKYGIQAGTIQHLKKEKRKKKKKSEYFSKVQHKKYENGKRTIYVWYEYTFTFKKFVTKIHKYLTYIFWK